jgi:hypothetical protein
MNGQKCNSFTLFGFIRTECSASTDTTTDFISFTIQNQYNTDTSTTLSNLKIIRRFTDGNGVSQTFSDFKIPSISGPYHGYFKISKSLNNFNFFISDDEVTWIQIGSTLSLDFNFVCIYFIHPFKHHHWGFSVDAGKEKS